MNPTSLPTQDLLLQDCMCSCVLDSAASIEVALYSAFMTSLETAIPPIFKHTPISMPRPSAAIE